MGLHVACPVCMSFKGRMSKDDRIETLETKVVTASMGRFICRQTEREK